MRIKVTQLVFSRDGKSVVGLGVDRRIHAWHTVNFGPISILNMAENTSCLLELQNGLWLTGHDDGVVRGWVVGNEEAVWSWTPEVGHVILGFDPTGNWLATRSTGGGQMQLWDLKARIPIGPPVSVAGKVTEVQWGVGGTIMTRSGRTIRLAKLPSGSKILDEDELSAQTGMAADHVLTPDEWRKLSAKQRAVR
jgi:WD40 repeat protein